jgi:hypothetical protein
MPYIYVDSLAVPKGVNGMWSSPFLSDKSVDSLFRDYSIVYLKLKETTTDEEGYVNIEFFDDKRSYSGTLAAMLDANGENTIPLTPDLNIEARVREATYFDAIRHNFHVKLGIIGVPDAESYPRSEQKDLLVKKSVPGTHLKMLHTHGIPLVNGYLHRTDYSPDENTVYVLGGGSTNTISNMNTIGFIDFRKVGRVEKIAITDDMISNLADKPLFRAASLNLEGKVHDLDKKTILLSVGGYLFYPKNDVFYRVDEDSWILSLSNTPYIERLIESSKNLDLTSLGMTDLSLFGKHSVNSEEVTSDEFIRKYLKLSQSFIIAVGVNRMAFEKQYVRGANMPGIFTTPVEPTYPLMVGYGKFVCYWKEDKEDNIWQVTVDDSFYRRYILSEDKLKVPRVYTDQEAPFRNNYFSNGYMLKIMGYNLL